MVDASPSQSRQNPPSAAAAPLTEREIRCGIELLYFGYSNMIGNADSILARRGLGRAHHRALYFIARQPGLAVSDLLRLLAITKQSLARVLGELVRRRLVGQTVGTTDRRQRLLCLTPAGATLEAELFAALRQPVTHAYQAAGAEAVAGFRAVLLALLPPATRELVAGLDSD